MKGLGFYEIAAQLLPLLVASMVIEGRAFALTKGRLVVCSGCFVLMAIIAEAKCLHVLSTERAATGDVLLVWHTLASLCAFILVMWLLRVREQLRQDSRRGASV